MLICARSLVLYIYTGLPPQMLFRMGLAVGEHIGVLKVIDSLGVRVDYIGGTSMGSAVGGLYAAGTFKMSFSEIIIFGILINITAGLGALFFSYVDDRTGPKFVIKISLIFLLSIHISPSVIS